MTCFPTGKGILQATFFTSLLLVRSLFGRNLTCTGTIRHNKPEIPAVMQSNRMRQINSCIYAFQQNVTMISYVPKKNKSVILLSSLHDDDQVDAEEPHKPQMILDYNSSKGGVDSLDQMAREYSCKKEVT